MNLDWMKILKLAQDEEDEVGKEGINPDELLVEVAHFLHDEPNADDEMFHRWAEEQGYDIEDAEGASYRLATMAARMLFGGKSKGEFPEVDPEQLRKGMQVEAEHVDVPLLRAKVAIDHLVENSRYYDYLDEMEKKMKAEEKKK